MDLANETREIATKAANSSASIINIVEVLEEHNEENLADVLRLEDRMEDTEKDVGNIKAQLGTYTIKEISEAEYEGLVSNDLTDVNTLYLIPEEEE